MISHFEVSATGLMAASLAMSGLAMLITLVATSIFVASMNLADTSPIFRAGRAFVSVLLEKFWPVSLQSMLAIYSAIGGAAAGAVVTAEMFDNKIGGAPQLVATLIVALAGAVSLSGSLIAWSKINGLIQEPPSKWGRPAFGIAVIAIVLVTGGYIAFAANGGAALPIAATEPIFWFLGSALLFGALITLHFSRAQMPVLISLYNACTGLAIGLEGLMLRNQALLIAGVVIGTARLFVTLLMVEASHENWNHPAHATGAWASGRHAPRFSGMRGRHKPL